MSKKKRPVFCCAWGERKEEEEETSIVYFFSFFRSFCLSDLTACNGLVIFIDGGVKGWIMAVWCMDFNVYDLTGLCEDEDEMAGATVG
jgi:hypothetical protein